MEAELSRHASAAVDAERDAMTFDERGDYTRAVHFYDLCLQRLSLAEATAVNSSAMNPSLFQDLDSIRNHQREVRQRIDHLNSLPPNVAPVPMKDMISTLQLTQVPVSSGGGTGGGSDGGSADKKVLGTKAGAALVGATAGMILLGPISAVALGGAAVYACTRKDTVGDAAKTIGKATSSTINKAISVDQKHQITTKAADLAKKTGNGAVRLGKQAAESDAGKAMARHSVAGAGAVSKWYNKNFGEGSSSSSTRSSGDGGFPQARNSM